MVGNKRRIEREVVSLASKIATLLSEAHKSELAMIMAKKNLKNGEKQK